MIKLLKQLKISEWIQVLISLIFIVVQVWLDLKLPDYMSEITRYSQVPESEMSDIWIAGGKMMLCALESSSGNFIIENTMNNMSKATGRKTFEFGLLS